jgi:predicted RNA-binding protein with PUA-like domain
MRYWLMKTEPTVFSLDDLRNMPHSTDHWEGVRNYQARNYMRDDMKKGDRVLFYHSNCEEPGVAGIAEVSKEAYPDFFSWDPKSPYFDLKSTPENPKWFMVDLIWKQAFKRKVSLKDMRENPRLKNMKVLQKGQRLSILPLTKDEFDTVYVMGMKNNEEK